MIRRMATVKFLIIFVVINEYSSANKLSRVAAAEETQDENSTVVSNSSAPSLVDISSESYSSDSLQDLSTFINANSDENNGIDFPEENFTDQLTSTVEAPTTKSVISKQSRIKSSNRPLKSPNPIRYQNMLASKVESSQEQLVPAESKFPQFKAGTPINAKFKKHAAARRVPKNPSQSNVTQNFDNPMRQGKKREKKQFKKQKKGNKDTKLPPKRGKQRRRKNEKVKPAEEIKKANKPVLPVKPDHQEQLQGCSIEGRWYNRWGTEVVFQLGPVIGNMQDVEGMYLGEIPLKTSASLQGIKTLLKNRASFGFATALRGPVMGFVGQCYIINKIDILEGMWLHKKPSTLHEDWDSIRVGFDIFKRLPPENATSVIKMS